MFILLAYFLAPLISIVAVEMRNKEDENILVRLRNNPRETIIPFVFYFLVDNIVLLLIVTLLRGSVNVTESMRNGSRFMFIYLILSIVVGIGVPIAENRIKQIYDQKSLSVNVTIGRYLINTCKLQVTGSVVAICVGIFGIILNLLQCIDNNFWGDEAFSIVEVGKAVGFLDVAKCDHSHPPFFQLILKAFMIVFGQHYWVYHLTSATAAILLLIFSITVIRKTFGNGASCIFSLMMIMTGIGRSFALEVRQYEWASLFVVLCLYEGYMLLRTRGGIARHWIFFCISGIGAAYSHYFAFAGIILIYFMTFLRLVIEDRKILWKCCVAIAVSVGAYLPWLMIFVREVVKTTSDGFWISGVVSLKDGFTYIFGDIRILRIYQIMLVLSVIWVYGIVHICVETTTRKKIKIVFFDGISMDDSITWMAITGSFAAFMIFAFEIFYGSITTPIFTSRYVYPVAVAIWLSFAVLLMNISFPKLRGILYIALVIMLIYAFWPSFYSGIFSYFQANKTTQAAAKQINSYIQEDDTVVLSDISHLVWTVSGYYFPGVPFQTANLDEKYEFDDEYKNVILILSGELSEDDLKKWKRKLHGDIEYVANTSLAGYGYYMYNVDLW